MFKQINSEIQEIIDSISKREYKTANSKIELVNNKLNDLLDTSVDDEFLREISKYLVLVEHLQNKLNESE
jgi:predicted house-cleaning noncanonical NTP pyrophosphatase (MazG superfamily)